MARSEKHAESFSPANWLDAHGRVAADDACFACGYNLRTLAPSETCPECRHPVCDSIPLRCYPRPWLKRLRRGFGLFALAYFLWPIVSSLLTVNSGIWPRTVGERVQPSIWWQLSIIIPPILIAATQLWGNWLVTGRLPTGSWNYDLKGRRVLRACIPVALGAACLSSALSTSMQPHKHVIYLVANLISSSIGAIMAVCWFALIGDLARRLPSTRIKNLSKILLVLCSFGFVAGFGFSLLQLAMAMAAPPPALPYAMEEGIVPGQYVVFEEDGSMVRTTTAPSSMLVPPAERPAWLETLYAQIVTANNFYLYSIISTVSAGGQLVLALVMAGALHATVRKSDVRVATG